MTYKKASSTSFCTKERKTRYRDDLAAKLAIMTLSKYSERETVPNRSYRCHSCKGFHLTSQQKRVDTTIQK